MFGVQMNDLEGVLRDSPDDQEMQHMAEEEQHQLQQQVCFQALSAELLLHQSGAESSDHNTSATCIWPVGIQSIYPVVLRHMPLFAKGPFADLSCSCCTTSYIRHVFDNIKGTCLFGGLLPKSIMLGMVMPRLAVADPTIRRATTVVTDASRQDRSARHSFGGALNLPLLVQPALIYCSLAHLWILHVLYDSEHRYMLLL